MKVKPALLSDVGLTSAVTEYSGHARDIVSSLPGCCVDTILCVGGDGLIFEVANGILKRSDAERFSQIPLAAIPCGTATTLCARCAQLVCMLRCVWPCNLGIRDRKWLV